MQARILNLIVTSMGDGVVVVDRQGKFLLFNPAAEQIIGLGEIDVDPADWSKTYGIYLPDQVTLYPPHNLPLARAMRGENVAITDLFIRNHKSPQGVWVTASARPLRNEQGDVCGGVLVFQDVTERKNLEEQLREAQKMEAIGRFAAGIAHDFKNYLTAINAWTHLAIDSLAPEAPARKLLKEVSEVAQRSAHLTRQLQAFSSQQQPVTRVFSLNDLVRDLEPTLQRILGDQVQLITALEARTSRVTADPEQFERVLLNLAVNARDAMPRGGELVIETSDVSEDSLDCKRCINLAPGQCVLLAVTDSGVGMTQEVSQHIFAPFFTTKESGGGLGLAVVYGIVKQSKGHISVDSVPGRGTCIRIHLPQTLTLECERSASRGQDASPPR
jgi:hypothetical protein